MAFPQGFVFQPSVSLSLPFGSGLLLGPRSEKLGRSVCGSAFAPYSASAASPVFNVQVPYGGEPRVSANIGSFVSPGFESSSGISGSLEYHPFGPLGAYPYADASYRKNTTRDATATLKAWLSEHRRNPYPTKGEKIMLAIITKMTLTQVSTWFANARRRLKKENKMTWTPRNRSEDEDEEDNVELERHDEDEELMKLKEGETELKSNSAAVQLSDSCRTITQVHIGAEQGLTGPDSLDLRLSGSSCSSGFGPLEASRGSELTCAPSLCTPSKQRATQGPNPTPKPKLWSLAEIATSSDRNDRSQSSGQSSLSYCPTLFCPSSVVPRVSGLGSLRPVAARDCGLRSHAHTELLHLQRGMTNV